MLLLNDHGWTNRNTATLIAMMIQVTTGFLRVGLMSRIGNMRALAYDARGGHDDPNALRHRHHGARFHRVPKVVAGRRRRRLRHAHVRRLAIAVGRVLHADDLRRRAHDTRPDLAITVSNPCTRHPAVAASACASVQQISQGRFRFGMASGDSALRNIGVQPGGVDLMERYMRAIQAMTAGESFDWDGHAIALHWLPQPTPVPVWIAAEGPRTQRMAGRYADGVVLSNCLTPERLAVAMEHLAAGAAEVGRSVDDIEIWHMCNLIFAKSEDEGINQIRSVLAGTANHVFRFTLEGKGLPDDLKDACVA